MADSAADSPLPAAPQAVVLEGGVAAAHPPIGVFPLRVAPTTDSQKNTVNARLVPLACWRVDDLRFKFDSSFLMPETADEFTALALLMDRHSDQSKTPPERPPMTIFGHADPVGNEEYNKTLSGRRALAVYATLIHNVSRWEKLFTEPFGGDDWKKKGVVETMIGALAAAKKATAAAPNSNVSGNEKVDDKNNDNDSNTNASTSSKPIVDFQKANGLPPDGIAGPATRAVLFTQYMDFLCTVPGRKDPLKLDARADFLAANSDAGQKGDVQGCGEFNPVLLFSKSEKKAFDQDTESRDDANAINRRVMGLLFRPGSKVDPQRWPCPRVTEPTAGCRKRFWSDAERRIALGDERRLFSATQDTFACRFYQRMQTQSPCERQLLAPMIVGLFDVANKDIDRTVSLAIFDGQNQQVELLAGKDAVESSDGFLVFRLDPKQLPDPVRLAWLTREGELHLAGPCSPVDLRDALVRRDLDTGQVLVGDDGSRPAPPPPPPSPPDDDVVRNLGLAGPDGVWLGEIV